MEDECIFDRIENPFRHGLKLTLRFVSVLVILVLLLSLKALPFLAIVEELSGELQGFGWAWKWILIGIVIIASLSFGYSYLGYRIGEGKARWYLFLVLGPPLIALFYWLVHHA